jgi:hypothetical protein
MLRPSFAAAAAVKGKERIAFMWNKVSREDRRKRHVTLPTTKYVRLFRFLGEKQTPS